MLSRRHLLAAGMVAFGLSLTPRLPGSTLLEERRRPSPVPDGLRRKAESWLVAQQQPDGRLVPGDRFAVGITALAALALAAPGGVGVDHQAVRKAADFVTRHRQPDGGIYDPSDGNALYTTALALQLQAVLGERTGIEAGQAFLHGRQHHEGGVNDGGYIADSNGLPDLHATTAAIDGLVATGLPATDPHLLAAQRFVLACQEGGYGGARYSPDDRLARGDHDASGGAVVSAKAEAYGAMTHAYLADLIVLGLDRDDPRLRSALAWIGRTWSLDQHPGRPVGRGQEGLFGYYVAAGKACHLLGQDFLERPDGSLIDWRLELAQALAARAQVQRLVDGAEGVSWRNGADRWGEAMPHLATTYALRCLAWIEEV